MPYIVRETENKWEELAHIFERIRGTGIVYVRSRQRTKEIADFFVQSGFSADFYHAGLNSADKTRKQTAWKNNEIRIIVCTNAFGMGIDKPDVRAVVHTDLPNSIEEYFQEAGRAGRDGQKSYAIVLYEKNDSAKLKKRVRDEFPERDFILHVYDSLAYFFQIAEGYGMDMMYDFDIRQFCAAYKLPLLPTHNAMKILDLAGFIEYIDEVDNRSRLMFLIYRDGLYHYNFDREFETLVNTVLRLYTGPFAGYVTINETEIGQRIDKTRKEVYEMLRVLDKRRIIDYIPHKKIPLVAYKQPRVDTKYLTIPRLVNEDRKDRFEKRIQAISYYASQADICRSRLLLSYFDENKTDDCRQCDVCLSKGKRDISNESFEEIASSIKKLLHEEELLISTVIDKLQHHPPEKITATIRFLLDRGEVALRLDKIKLVVSSN